MWSAMPAAIAGVFALSLNTTCDLVFHGEITQESLKSLRDYVDITVRVLSELKKDSGA
jgi:hypothetical protein